MGKITTGLDVRINYRNVIHFLIMAMLAASSFFVLSFTVARKIGDDFLKQLGISQQDANGMITNSFLGSYFDQYGVRNAKNIASGDRATIVKDLLIYTKAHVNSGDFIREYNTLKEKNKPKFEKLATPDEVQKNLIEQSRKMVADMEKNGKNADASMQKVYDEMLTNARKQLKEVEDPNYKYFLNYREHYPEMVKSQEAANKGVVDEWEKKYPADHLQFIKTRLNQFLEVTADISFDAQLFEKNGKKYFVEKQFENKGNQWKMAFRAGKEVVEPARIFVQQWLEEIK